MKNNLRDFGISMLFLFSLVALASCGQAFKAGSTASSAQGSSCTECTGAGETPTDDVWKNADLDSDMNSGPFADAGGHTVIELDKDNKLIIITMPLLFNPLFQELVIQINEMPGATLNVTQEGNRWVLKAKIPLEYIMRGVDFSDPTKLPTGDPFPGFPDGELPKTAVHIFRPGLDVYIYAGRGAAAMYLPLPNFNPTVSTQTFPLKSRDGKTVGYFRLLPKTSTNPGGFYLSAILPADLARFIDAHFK